MIFMPTESLILGLFIIAAVFIIVACVTNTCKLFSDIKYQKTIGDVFFHNIWLGRIFLILALAAGISSSFIPVQ